MTKTWINPSLEPTEPGWYALHETDGHTMFSLSGGQWYSHGMDGEWLSPVSWALVARCGPLVKLEMPFRNAAVASVSR